MIFTPIELMLDFIILES